MKATLLALVIALTLFGCGGSDSTTSDEFSPEKIEELLGPEITPPPGPPPKKLVTEDVEKGSGPVARQGDQAEIHYISVYYDTGELVERWWLAKRPVSLRVGENHYRRAFEKGIAGMREGGRREVIEPARFVSTNQALIHLIELTSLEPAAGGD